MSADDVHNVDDDC